jgi:hypothetical protein
MSSIIAEFIEDCIEFNPEIRMMVSDFNAAFASWWREHPDHDEFISADGIDSMLKKLAHPKIAIDENFKNSLGCRYYCGIQLSETGKHHWRKSRLRLVGTSDFSPPARIVGISHRVTAVRSHIPAGARWWDHPLNVKIRKS